MADQVRHFIWGQRRQVVWGVARQEVERPSGQEVPLQGRGDVQSGRLDPFLPVQHAHSSAHLLEGCMHAYDRALGLTKPGRHAI